MGLKMGFVNGIQMLETFLPSKPQMANLRVNIINHQMWVFYFLYIHPGLDTIWNFQRYFHLQ